MYINNAKNVWAVPVHRSTYYTYNTYIYIIGFSLALGIKNDDAIFTVIHPKIISIEKNNRNAS